MPRGIPRNKIAEPIAPLASEPALAPQSSRAAETRRERRRRDDGSLDRMMNLKLAIPRHIQEQADREGKTLRWVLDQPGRMQQMEADDWDKVPGVQSVAADKESGDQLVLCAKYKDWFDADQAASARMLDERDKALVRGDKIDPDDKRQGATSYTPAGNRISRQRGA